MPSLQRAKELGYINGYKYGVEYETNGEKPNLPDDITVSYRAGMWLGVTDVETANWERANSFEIIDSRYKPKEESVSEIPESDNNSEDVTMNNDWHKKGELPPANTEC